MARPSSRPTRHHAYNPYGPPRREHALLTRLQGRLLVPPVQKTTTAALTPGFAAGAPGQELLDAGQPETALASCGEVLRRIHDIAPSVLLRAGLGGLHPCKDALMRE